jgi:hypothetical protein
VPGSCCSAIDVGGKPPDSIHRRLMNTENASYEDDFNFSAAPAPGASAIDEYLDWWCRRGNASRHVNYVRDSSPIEYRIHETLCDASVSARPRGSQTEKAVPTSERVEMVWMRDGMVRDLTG